MNKRLLFLFVIVYCLLFAFVYPWYQYVFDPDATGYLRVAERIAAGDYWNSVNGYWSPLNSWLLAPFIKMGFNAVLAAKWLNGVFGVVALINAYFLLKKFKLHSKVAVAIMALMVIVFLHFAFYQLFGDFLQVLCLLIYLNIICSKGFIKSNKKIILSSIVCGVAYYAKYYSLYFGVIFIAITFFLLLKNDRPESLYKTWIKKAGLALLILVLIALPWAITLSSKYHNFSFTTSGKINYSWYLSVAYEQPRVLVQPLAYDNSSSFWDDPSFWKGDFITPVTNKAVFLFQIKLFISHVLQYIGILNAFSFLTIIVLLLCAGLYLYKEKSFIYNNANSVLLVMALVMPIGYLLVSMDDRYVWMVYISAIILAGVLLTVFEIEKRVFSKLFTTIIAIVFGSFCIYPLNQLQNQKASGKNVYEIAEALKKNSIHGKFIANCTTAEEQANCTVLAYLVKDQFYGPSVVNVTPDEMNGVISDYRINYQLVFYNAPLQKQQALHSTQAQAAAKVFPDLYPGVIVLQYK
ncbi:glycosyltransferase family 39 protein [Ferruginibacter albus]|uniref:glycosyltransferase family 39 protein n=1 Tax=Ferruginibacter albus TaxID=2875540 RepID=UPI001CC46536|nr:glycosyltransferase family 39 protein [Ferruginibacter albus]UAY53152.1 glycosyltransferase family 39 protein [Ferruginibacter albus]